MICVSPKVIGVKLLKRIEVLYKPGNSLLSSNIYFGERGKTNTVRTFLQAGVQNSRAARERYPSLSGLIKSPLDEHSGYYNPSSNMRYDVQNPVRGAAVSASKPLISPNSAKSGQSTVFTYNVVFTCDDHQ
jgi:hypothetical protein